MFSFLSVLPSATNVMHRADYLDRGLTPHLLNIGERGLRAEFMKPVFPVSFPDRYDGTLLTYLTVTDFPVSNIFHRVFFETLKVIHPLAIIGALCMCSHDISTLSNCRLFDRTGLYVESHGIVANVSHKRAVLNSILTRCADFLGCRNRNRV
jgi:hypothetical protein